MVQFLTNCSPCPVLGLPKVARMGAMTAICEQQGIEHAFGINVASGCSFIHTVYVHSFTWRTSGLTEVIGPLG